MFDNGYDHMHDHAWTFTTLQELLVPTLPSGFREVQRQVGVWKYAITMSGELFAMIYGMLLMQVSCAGSSDSLIPVRHYIKNQ